MRSHMSTGLCTKLQKRSQPGIRAILAVLRDEVTAQYLQQRKEAAGTPPTLGSNIELLFGVRTRVAITHTYTTHTDAGRAGGGMSGEFGGARPAWR